MRHAGVAETSIGILILALLAGVAAGMYVAQSRFDPDLFAIVLQKDGNAAVHKSSLPSPASSPVPAFLPEDMVPLGPEETFDSESLSDKIDGKAELYLSSGFVKLSTRRFALKSDPKSWLELYVYEMGNPTNAFSVYSVQKRTDSKPADLGVSAYATADALFFANGAKYYEIISASKNLTDDMTALAKNLVESEPRHPGEIAESSLFPPQYLDESSISLHLSDVFGFSGLDRVYTAGYYADGSRVTAFISKRENDDEASGLATAYGKFLLENGGSDAGDIPDAPDAKIYKVFDTYEVVLHRGKFFAGAHEADEMKSAVEVASRIYQKLGEAGQ